MSTDDRWRTERDRCANHADDFETLAEQLVITRSQEPARRPFAQQLDTDGRLHDLAPQTRQERLFEPAPFAQLDGQQYLDTERRE